MIRRALLSSMVLLTGLALPTLSASFPIPLRVLRDGSATSTTWTGSDKELIVSGASNPTISWMEFQPDTSAKTAPSVRLDLFVRTVTQAGTLNVYALSSPIASMENGVRMSDLVVTDKVPLTTVSLGAGTAERLISIDLGASKSRLTKGLVLASDDGLFATLAAKESGVSAQLVMVATVPDSAVVGPVGPQGLMGLQGATGSVGPQGLPGIAGAKGDTGARGAMGPQGPKGDSGVQGATGAKGDVGATGPVGPQGAKGDVGATGAQGLVGLTGSVGPQGPQGLAGKDGSEGALGPQGSAGCSPTSTSGSTLTIVSSGSAPITFDTCRAAFSIGQRVRITQTSAPSNFMEGSIAAYNGNTGNANISIDYSSGTGTNVQGWTITTAGVRGVQGPQGIQGKAGASPPNIPVYRYNTFHTFEQSINWKADDSASLYGGVKPSLWTDGNGRAYQMSSDKNILRSFLTKKGYGGSNALIVSDQYYYYSSTDGQVTVVLFRIQNTTALPINWHLHYYYSAYSAWSEVAGVALNGIETWNSIGVNTGSRADSVTLSIPPSRTSSVIFSIPSGIPQGTRGNLLAFFNHCLLLPAGLEYVDDLDTAAGGWEQ